MTDEEKAGAHGRGEKLTHKRERGREGGREGMRKREGRKAR